MKVINVQQGTDEWHAWRASGIGASESAAILGKSSFKTAYQLWLEKTNRVPGFSGNPATAAGKEAEGKAKAEYEMLHGDFEVFEPLCVEHEIYPSLIASLDGYSKKLHRIVEIKYPSQDSHEMALAGGTPEHYWIQCQHQIACVGDLPDLDYWSYREGNGAKISVPPDLRFIEEILIPSVIAFQELVNCDIAPPLTDKDAKWVEDKEILSYVDELLSTNNKDERNHLSSKIISLAGHPKVLCAQARITSVQKNGAHSYYKVTEYKS